MKITHLLITALMVLNAACRSDDDNEPIDPADALPPATQTGEQTFGCLINGEPFFPAKFGSNRPSAFYQFVDGAFTFVLSAARKDGSGEDFKSISLGALDIQPLTEGEYQLKSFESGNFFGQYLLGGGLVLQSYTSEDVPGKLIVTRIDDEEFIISGTFEFTVLDNNGNEIKITDGRFDLNYTN